MPWTPVGFDPNSLELVRNDGSYSADYSQHIVSDGGNITLPEPSKDEVVMVSNFDSTSTTIDSVSGNIEFETSRTIDGTEPVIFVSDGNNWWNVSGFSSLAPSIPDSAVSQYLINEGDSTTLNNNFDSEPNGTITGASLVSDSDLVGGWGLEFGGQGNADYVVIDDYFDFIDANQQFAFAVTVDWDTFTTNENLIWHTDGGGTSQIGVGTDNNGNEFAVRWRDSNGNNVDTYSIDNTTNRIRLGVDFNGETGSLEMFVNGDSQPDGGNESTTTSSNEHTFGNQNSGNTDRAVNGILDNPIWYNNILGEDGHSQDFNAQPWS